MNSIIEQLFISEQKAVSGTSLISSVDGSVSRDIQIDPESRGRFTQSGLHGLVLNMQKSGRSVLKEVMRDSPAQMAEIAKSMVKTHINGVDEKSISNAARFISSMKGPI